MGKSICFTGHRTIPVPEMPALREELRRVLTTAISHGFTDFYAGGAIGWDTYCAQVVLELRNRYPEIALHLVLPCPREHQTARWSLSQKQLYDRIYHMADSHELIGDHYTPTCMRTRNQRLVTLADCCICYCREEEPRSGTAQTVRMARQKGIPVINLR